MKKYKVSEFGVGLDYKEYNKVIWKGNAKDEQDAIDKAAKFNYD